VRKTSYRQLRRKRKPAAQLETKRTVISPTAPAPKTEAGKTKDRLNGGPNYQSQGQSRSGEQKVVNAARTLEPKASEVLRDQLIAQLKALINCPAEGP
jgi:hypothetical protein